MEFDWEEFKAESGELERRMREVADRNAREVAESRAARARYDTRPAEPLVARELPPSGSRTVEERLDGIERTLVRIEQELGTVKGDVKQIREQMATKVELESLKDDIRIVADGFAQTQYRIYRVTDLLTRYLTNP